MAHPLYQVEVIQVLGTILPIEDFFDEDTGEPTALAREFGVPVDVYEASDQHRVLHCMEHESGRVQCWHINWSGNDTIVVGRCIGSLQEIGWGPQLKVSARELIELSDKVQWDLDFLKIDQRVGVFLYTSHRFTE